MHDLPRYMQFIQHDMPISNSYKLMHIQIMQHDVNSNYTTPQSPNSHPTVMQSPHSHPTVMQHDVHSNHTTPQSPNSHPTVTRVHWPQHYKHFEILQSKTLILEELPMQRYEPEQNYSN